MEKEELEKKKLELETRSWFRKAETWIDIFKFLLTIGVTVFLAFYSGLIDREKLNIQIIKLEQNRDLLVGLVKIDSIKVDSLQHLVDSISGQYMDMSNALKKNRQLGSEKEAGIRANYEARMIDLEGKLLVANGNVDSARTSANAAIDLARYYTFYLDKDNYPSKFYVQERNKIIYMYKNW